MGKILSKENASGTVVLLLLSQNEQIYLHIYREYAKTFNRDLKMDTFKRMFLDLGIQSVG
jgi:hypothetical protein